MTAFGSQPSGSGFSFGASSSSGNKGFSFGSTAPKNPTPLANTFLPSSASTSPADIPMGSSNGENGDDEPDVFEEHLDPPAFTRKDKAKWKASGRTLLATAAPVGGGVAAWISKQPSKTPDEPAKLSDPELSLADNMVYVAAINSFPPALEDFYSSTCTVFTNLQQIIASAIRLPAPGAETGVWDSEGHLIALDGVVGPPRPETIVHMRKIVDMYLQDIDRIRTADVSEDIQVTFDQMYGIFNLVRILYLPADGRGQTLLGEELLDWVNQSTPAAINEDGNDIMNTPQPWDNPMFWPFLSRCVLRGFFPTVATFMQTLADHPHPPIAKLAGVIEQYATSFPRSEKFREDHTFLAEHKKWLVRFRSDVDTITGGRSRTNWLDTTGSGSREWSEWEDSFKALIELMEGKPDRVLAEVNDWREAIGAWGVLVDVWLRRDDLPEVVTRVLNEVPIDSTVEDDVVLSSICLGPRGVAAALRTAQSIDTWLAAHLADVFDKLGMVPDDDEFDMSTRDYLLLAHADSIMDSPSQWKLWRVVAEYLATAAEEGRSRLREYILHVALPFDSTPKEAKEKEKDGGMDENGEEEMDGDMAHFLDLQATCIALNLPEEWREICAILASRFMRRGEYGRAASLATQARDVNILSLIAEKIVTSYVDGGAPEFLKQVNSLPSNLLNDAPVLLDDDFADEERGGPLTLYAQRLSFLAEFRDYLLFMGEGTRDRAASRICSLIESPATPVAFAPVLLSEAVELLEDDDIRLGPSGTFELMRILEDVLGNARFAPNEYLHLLVRYIERETQANGNGAQKKDKTTDEKYEEALRKLEVVRLALARNLSRAMVAGLER